MRQVFNNNLYDLTFKIFILYIFRAYPRDTLIKLVYPYSLYQIIANFLFFMLLMEVI